MATKTDCASYNKKQRKCNALEKVYCARQDKCSFYKTREQADEDRRKSFERRCGIGIITEYDIDYIKERQGG